MIIIKLKKQKHTNKKINNNNIVIFRYLRKFDSIYNK